MSHFKVRENEIVGGGIKVVKFNLFSSTLLISYPKTPENVIVGAGVSYLCKITASRAPAASQITFSSSVVFLFPPQNSRKCRCGVLVGILFNSCTCSTSHAPATIWFACFQFLFSMSHFKVRENKIVGGGIKVVKFNLFSSTLLICYLKTPKNVIVGAGVSYLCKFTTSRAPAASQITFSSSVVFLFPPQSRENVGVGCW